MDEQILKKETTHDISIALIQKDMQYVRESIAKIETSIAMMDRNYAKRDEFNSVVELVKQISQKIETKASHEDVKAVITALSTKVDHADFDPIKKILARINWIMISGVVVALLSLVITAGNR